MKLRKLLFWCHLVTGCAVGIVILIMSVTGALLAFERQCIAAMNARYVSTPHAGGISIESIVRGAVDPAAKPLPSVTIQADPNAAVRLSFGRERVLFLDRSTGARLGEESGGLQSFFGTIERIHRSLGGELRNSPGRNITGVCNLAFLFLVVSGFYLWFPKKFSAQSFRLGLWFKKDLQGRARDLNWHKTIGFWSAIPLFFIVLTGVIMSYAWATNLLYRVTGTVPPPVQTTQERGEARRPHDGDNKPEAAKQNFRTLDELLTIAGRNTPGWKTITFRVPEDRDRAVTFAIDTENGGQPQKRVQLTLNRVSGELRRQEGFATYNLGRKLRMIARFLHTGEILGIGGQMIFTLASLGGAFLVYTGIVLAIRRLGRWKRRKAELGQATSLQEEQLESLSR
jgi:uncharacterized iron-regulated membrane protein